MYSKVIFASEYLWNIECLSIFTNYLPSPPYYQTKQYWSTSQHSQMSETISISVIKISIRAIDAKVSVLQDSHPWPKRRLQYSMQFQSLDAMQTSRAPSSAPINNICPQKQRISGCTDLSAPRGTHNQKVHDKGKLCFGAGVLCVWDVRVGRLKRSSTADRMACPHFRPCCRGYWATLS